MDTSTLASAVTGVSSKMNKLDTLLPDNAATFASSQKTLTGYPVAHSLVAGDINDVWAGTQWMSHPMCSGGESDPHCQVGSDTVHLKEWMGYQIDPEAVRDNGSSINIFGRLSTTMKVICAFGSMLPTDAGGLPSVGTVSITFDTAAVTRLSSECGMDASDMLGASVPVVVAQTSDTTTYDRSINLGGMSIILLRFNSSEINMAMGEDQGNGFSRTLVAYNQSTGVVRAEYVSANHDGGNSGGEFGRLYYDAPNDVGAMFYSTHDWGGSPNRLVYSLRGKPETGSEVAFSARAVGGGLTSVNGSYNWNTIFQACVSQENGAIATADTLSCADGVTGTAADTTGFETVINDIYTSTNSTNYSSYVDSSIYNETIQVPFASADQVYSVVSPHVAIP